MIAAECHSLEFYAVLVLLPHLASNELLKLWAKLICTAISRATTELHLIADKETYQLLASYLPEFKNLEKIDFKNDIAAGPTLKCAFHKI